MHSSVGTEQKIHEYYSGLCLQCLLRHLPRFSVAVLLCFFSIWRLAYSDILTLYWGLYTPRPDCALAVDCSGDMLFAINMSQTIVLPYKFYVLGQIGLSKQCRPRSDCF